MVTRTDKIVFALIILLAAGAFFYLKGGTKVFGAKPNNKEQETEKGKKKKKRGKGDGAAGDAHIKVLRKWDMPDDLKEISGIAWISNNEFACVQDELGKIFIYNTGSSRIEREIQFGDAGDYEGIAIVGSTAYIIRADGNLFEVAGYNSSKPGIRQHSTHLTAKHDVEGLCYDRKNNRLLLAIKGKESNDPGYKGIYAFDLTSKKLSSMPVFKIGLVADPSAMQGKVEKLQPSDIEVHPSTGDIYIIDGPDSKLLVLGNDGKQKNFYQLSGSEFPQPEGISFNANGELFISNEGRTGIGNILQVSVSDQL